MTAPATLPVNISPAVRSQPLSLESMNPLANLAHELRQPLSSIEAIVYLLETDASLSAEDTRRYLGQLQLAVAQANRILCDAIDPDSSEHS